VKPAAFKYSVADSVERAVTMKAHHGDDAKFLAGGQSLIPAMNFRLARPSVLIDINPLAALDYVHLHDSGAVLIGALTRLRTVQESDLIARHQPLVHETVPHVAHAQIRNRGTLCGNLANADPASELPAVVVALNARLRASSLQGDRWIAARDFFRNVFTTALGPDELLVEIELPRVPARTGMCFVEIARRRGDYAMMGVAAVLSLDRAGACAAARLVYCNAGATPIQAVGASDVLIGEHLDEPHFTQAATIAQGEIDPPGTVHASKSYQTHLAGVLTRRALATAYERAIATIETRS
jgi:CO/xanthine dehydrogenase FAD-binding subunit